jgi:RecA-family ATPase
MTGMIPAELLASNGIALESTTPGRYYTTCPQCSHTRSKAHQTAKCLGITIEGDCVRWGCNHCGWTGPEKGIGKSNGGLGPHDDRNFIATYDYIGFQKVRYPKGHEPPFRIRHRKGKRWEWGAGGADTSVLYRIDDVKEAIALGRRIAIVEGEKDANNLWAINIPATCNAHGASEPDKKPKWTKEHSEQLRGADIIVFNDNDPQGYAHADVTCRLSVGVAKRVCRLDLALHWPNMPKGKDVSDWLDASHTREHLDALIEQAPDWTPQPEPAPEQAEAPPPTPLQFIDMSNWDNEPVPEQEWAVLNRIPLRQCVLFSGEGAAGKSTVELHRSAAHVLGREWLGTLPELGPAIYLDAEDEADVLHRRLAAIIRHYNVTFAELIGGGLHLLSFAGQDALLATVNHSGKVEPTTLYKQLLQAAGDIKPKSITIASCANVFTGDENNRSQVQQFVGLLTRMAIIADGSVALISHPSLTGINSDSGISGTTQWHNAMRARIYMKSPKPKPDEQPDTDLREIVFKKNQYGPVSESIALRYRDGMFLPLPSTSTLDGAAHEAKADSLFQQLLARITERGENISPKRTANMFAPSVFAKEPEARANGIGKKDFEAAMARLLDTNKIHLGEYGPRCRETKRLLVGPNPSVGC